MEIKLPELPKLANSKKNFIAHALLRGFIIYLSINFWIGFFAEIGGEGFWLGVMIANYIFWVYYL